MIDPTSVICRGCMSTNLKDLQNVFTNHLPQLYTALTSLTISPDDGLPIVICFTCKKNLENYNEFRMQCIKSHNMLEQHKLGKTNVKIEIIKQDEIAESESEDEIVDSQYKNNDDIRHQDDWPVEIKIEFDKLADANKELAEPIKNKISAKLAERSYDDVKKLECFTPRSLRFESIDCEPEMLDNIRTSPSPTDETAKQKGQLTKTKQIISCTKCSRIFNKASALKNHMRSHKESKETKVLQCDICSKRFPFMNKLKRHILIKHAGILKFPCDICPKRFGDAYRLRAHKLVHSNQRPFSCTQCPKTFLRSTSLKRHYLIHSDKKPYICEICSQGFNQLGNMKLHLMTHTGERPQICTICDKSFTQLATLRAHMTTHDARKPRIPCTLCTKHFSSRNGLRQHMLMHTGHKPHVCELCQKAFYFPELLKRHRLVHTEEKRCSCPVCGNMYARSDYLKIHMRKHSQ